MMESFEKSCGGCVNNACANTCVNTSVSIDNNSQPRQNYVAEDDKYHDAFSTLKSKSSIESIDYDEQLPLISGQELEDPISTNQPHIGFKGHGRGHGSITGSIISVISQDSILGQQHYTKQDKNGTMKGYSSTGASNLHCHRTNPSRKQETRNAKRKLIVASVVVLFFLVGEFIGGYIANSLAVMTDAAHLLSDFAGFMISLFAIWLGSRPATKKLSFGYYRAEVMGALLSVLIIWVLTGILIFEAIDRIIHHNIHVNATIMLITSGVGVVINIILAFTLHGVGHGHSHGVGGGSHSHSGSSSNLDNSHHSHNSNEVKQNNKKKNKENVNVRAAAIHVLGDLVQSVGVFIASLLIYFKPAWKIADPICTFLFSILVLITTLTILKDILLVLMEGTPKGLDFKEVMADLQNLRGVQMIHNLHVWSLTMGTAALSVHLAIDNTRSTQSVLKEASVLVSKKYEIHHTTIQVERYQDQMNSCSMCQEPKD